MTVLLLLLSMLAWLINAAIGNRYGKIMQGSILGIMLYNIFCLLTASSLLLVLMRPYFWPSPYTLLLGVLFGVITVSNQMSILFAFSCGPMSLTMLIGSCAMVIPTFSGMFFWGESIGRLQLIGLALMVAVLFLCIYPGTNSPQKKMNGHWLALCLIVFITSGTIGIVQKTHQLSVYKNELNAFLVTAFLTGAILLTVIWIPLQRSKKSRSITPIDSTLFVMAGLATGGMNKINMYLSGVLPSILFFPVYNGGCVLLSAIVAVLVFKEKITKRQGCGLVMGVVAIAFLGN